MGGRIYGLTHEDKSAVKKGIERAKNNPLGRRGSKKDRRPQPQIELEKAYFQVLPTAVDKITIVDGFDQENAVCWEGILNEFDVTCLATELTITADAWIYALAVPVGADPWTDITVTIEQSSSKPLYEANKSKKLISRVTFANGAITDFSNENEEFNAILLKECT